MLHMVHSPAAPDMESFVNDLAEGVAAGHITGLGAVVLLRGQRFFVDVFGQLTKQPHEGRAMLLELDDCLRELAHQRRDALTTRGG